MKEKTLEKTLENGYLASEPLCPHCGTKLDGFTDATFAGHAPKDGDVSVCSYCLAYLVFDTDLRLKELPAEHLLQLPDDVRIAMQRYRRIVEAIPLPLRKQLERARAIT